MKKNAFFFVIIFVALSTRVYAQGWYVVVDLDLNHGLYAFENIAHATLTFSGVTVSGSSPKSTLNLVVMGTGPISGAISVSVSGTASEPYEQNDPQTQPLSIQYSGSYDLPCQTGLFKKTGDVPNSELTIWITIYPRLQIAGFVQRCDQITLTTHTCSPNYRWDVSDSATGNFKTLQGKSTSSIVVTRQELVDLGFADTYGRKYFRVSGQENTTSQLQPVDIYYPAPTASIETSPPKCHNGDDGMITLQIQSANPSAIDDFVITLFKGVPPDSALLQNFVNDNAHATFSGLKSGGYWVRIENNSNTAKYGNCWVDYPAGTLQNPQPVTIKSEISNYNGYGVPCAGADDGVIKVVPSGGSGAYSTFEWTPAVSSTDVADNLSAGSFVVKVGDTNGCWSRSLTNVLTEPKEISVKLVSTGGKNGYDVSCHDIADGKIEALVSGGVPTYNYLWSDRNITPWIKDLSAGYYRLSVTDGNGCSAATAITLEAPLPIDFAIEEISSIQCPGGQTGALEIGSVANTIGHTSYLWSSGEVDKSIADKAAGTYVATVSDEQGCSTTKSHILTEPLIHKVEIIAVSDFHGADISCNGTSTGQLRAIVLDPSGNAVMGQDFTWFRNGMLYQSGPDLETLNDLDAATYRAQVRYTEYCSAEATFALTEPDALVADIVAMSDYNGVPISCNGKADGIIEANSKGGTGDVSFLWSTGATTPGITGLPEGTYAVTATDINGCFAKAEMILNAPRPVEARIAILSDYHGTPISCTDSSDAQLRASAKGGTPPYQYLWYNGWNEATLDHLGAGTHSVTVLDVNGCNATADTTLIAPSEVVAKITDISDYNGYGTSCNGSRDGFIQASGSGGNGSYTYRWLETNTSNPVNSNLGRGQYTVVVSDWNGCTASAAASISEPDAVKLTVSGSKNVSCYRGSDGQINLIAEGGTGSYTYSADGTTWQLASQLQDLSAGVFQTKARDSNGCTAAHTQVLTEPTAIEITFNDMSPALCGDARGKISATITGGTPEYQYLWTDAKANVVSSTATASALYAGIYSLRITDTNQCQSIATMGISSTDGPTVQVAEVTTTSCSYNADGKARIEVLSGNAPFSFLWQDGQTSAEAVRLRKGNHMVEIRDANNCAAVASLIVPAPDSLVIAMTHQIEPSCFGDCNGSISVLAYGGTGLYDYNWGTSAGEEIFNICSGEYTVTVTDQNRCNASQTFTLAEPSPLDIEVVSQESPSCPGACDGVIKINTDGGTGDLNVYWSNGNTGNILNDLCAGTFAAHLADDRGCAITQTFTLATPPVQHLDLGGSVTLCDGQSHTLDAGAGWKAYSWSGNNGFTSDTRSVTLRDAAMYWLDATTAEGCLVRDTFILQTSTDLLKASFLMPSQANIGDTIVIVDISWPMPESVAWQFPEEMQTLDSPRDIIYGKFNDVGKYAITLSATLGACRDNLTKTIDIFNNGNDLPEEGRIGSEPFVKQFTLYPNPNDGKFDVVVEFRDESPIILTVWNLLTSARVTRIESSTGTYHRQHLDLRPLSAGSYSLRLDHADGTNYIRFIVR